MESIHESLASQAYNQAGNRRGAIKLLFHAIAALAHYYDDAVDVVHQAISYIAEPNEWQALRDTLIRRENLQDCQALRREIREAERRIRLNQRVSRDRARMQRQATEKQSRTTREPTRRSERIRRLNQLRQQEEWTITEYDV